MRKEENLQAGDKGFILSHLKTHKIQKRTKEHTRKRSLEKSPTKVIENQPKHQRKLFDDIFDSTPNVPTSNQFQPLATTSKEDDDNNMDILQTSDAENTPTIADQIRQKAAKTIKTPIKDKRPPIIVKGGATDMQRYKNLMDDLKQITKNKFTIKYTKNNIAIQTETIEDFDNVKRAMEGTSTK